MADAYQRYTPGNKGTGYDNQAIIAGGMGSHFETTNPSKAYDDKWTRWFGQPPYGHFQVDHYAQLGHENYQVRKWFFTYFYSSILTFFICVLKLPHAYIGRNLHLEKMINTSIASEDDYYTR